MTISNTLNILVVDDEMNIRTMLQNLLQKEGDHVAVCDSGEAAIVLIQQKSFDIVMLDVMLPGIDGIETLKKIKELAPQVYVLMMSGHADLNMAVEATKAGAYHFFEKPLNPDQIILECNHIKNHIQLETRLHSLENKILGGEIIGESDRIEKLKKNMMRIASTESRVLILGENGTGKELVARALHQSSTRAKESFISLNCAAIPHDLVESELFGHEKGAFTGAHQKKIGRIEQADGGTLFLDEIGDMHMDVQAKLLRVLEINEAVRVGGNQPYKFNVRILAATNKNLEDEIRAQRFRQDLYFRLNVISVQVPALRDRPEDIPLLSQKFLSDICNNSGMGVKTIDSKVYELMKQYNWPGNVRELKNFIERLVIMTDGNQITENDAIAHLPQSRNPLTLSPDDTRSYREQVQQFEYTLLKHYYDQFAGNLSQMASHLKIDRANLHRKLKSLNIH